MAFQYHKSSFRKSGPKKIIKNLLVILVGFGLFITFFLLVKSFRASADDKANISNTEVAATGIQNKQQKSFSEQSSSGQSISGSADAVLYFVDPVEGVGSTALGNARRQFSEGIFNINVSASLSEPDKTQEDNRKMYYEAWMVRPTPFDYISIGELKIDAEGKFAVLWSGARGESFFDYSKIIVTLEVDDGDDSPAQNILSGEF